MWLSLASRGKTVEGDCRIIQPRHAFRKGWKIGAKFAISPMGPQGILIFKVCDRYFQIALRKAWTSSTNCTRLHGFQFYWLLLTLGVVYNSLSWLFWLTSLPVLRGFLFGLILPLQNDSRAAPVSGPHIPFIRCPAHFTLYMCWPHLTSLECSVIHKSSFPAVLSQQAFTACLCHLHQHQGNC